MTKNGKSRFETALIAVVGVSLFVAAIVGVYFVGERQANYKTEELLGYACYDLPSTLRANAYSSLCLEAQVVAEKMGATNRLSQANMRELVDNCAFDEIYLIDKHGKVVAASEPSVVGRDLSTVPSMIEFLSLVETPDHVIEQPIRLSLANPEIELLYGGFPQPDESLILCGYTVGRLRKNFIESSRDLMSSWEIGETGSYAVVDDATGKLTFDIFEKAKAGDLFVDFGDPAALKVDIDADIPHAGKMFGKLCHYRVFDCYGLRVIVFVPHAEFHSSVMMMTMAVAVVLLVVFVIFGLVFHRVTVANQAIVRMREAEDKQRLKDMVMATSIQKHSLPTAFPPYPNHADDFDIYAFMQTAKEVGGDFYDFYFVGKNRMALVMADVSGKGVPAAMFMMRAKTTLQGLLKGGAALADAVAKANDHLCEGNLEDMFVTAWVGVCNLTTGEIEYVNAGHNPPIVRRADGSVEWIAPRSGLVLAAMPGATYRIHKLTLGPGDGLVLYTDGVTEAQDVNGSLYGEERLERATLAIDVHKDAKGYCDGILASISEFATDAEQADDITMLAFRMKRLVAAVKP